MSKEDTIVEDVNIDAGDGEDTPAAPEYSKAEQEALKHGWKPKDNWEGSDDDFISAPEFNRRAELFDKIASQGRQLKQIDSKYNQVLSLQAKLTEKAREQAIKELMEQKTAAYANEEFAKVVEIDEQIAAEKSTPVIETPTAPADSPEFLEWAKENSWYTTDPDLAELADTYGLAYGNKQAAAGRDVSTISMEELLNHVDKKMKPILNKPAPSAQPAVEAGSRGVGQRGSKKSFTEKDLTQDQKTIMRDIIKHDPSFTKEMYIESLVEIGELTK